MSYSFGGNTGLTYEQAQNRRKVAEQMRASNSRTPQNVGEGIHSIARALVARGSDRQANEAETRLRSEFDKSFDEVAPNVDGLISMANSPYASEGHKKVLEALMQGVPNYERGGFHPGGRAVVGENGPEVVELPPSVIKPNIQSLIQQYDPASQKRMIDAGEQPNEMDMRDLLGVPDQFSFGQQVSFDGPEVQTADMSGIEPSGTGERNQLHATARAFQGFNKSLTDYENLFNQDTNQDGSPDGSTMWPGTRRDQLSTAHYDLLLQAKELYNLGVLNGPDLEIMQEVLLDPTSIGGNVMDALGIADMEERVPQNIQDVRRMMLNRSTPALQQLGIEPESLLQQEKPKLDGLSDDELLKLLEG